MANDKITIFEREGERQTGRDRQTDRQTYRDLYSSATGRYCINTKISIQEAQKSRQQRAINIRQSFVSLRKGKPSK